MIADRMVQSINSHLPSMKKRCPMTQELVLVVLVTGLIGLLWVMTLAIWDGKHTSNHSHEAQPSASSDRIAQGERALKQETVAA